MKIGQFFKSFVSFRFIILAGIIMGLWIYSVHTEQLPLSALLTEKQVYYISALIVVGFHVLIWIILQKASLYNIMANIGYILRDILVINAVFLSTVAVCFLLSTFII